MPETATSRLDGFNVVYRAPVLMTEAERVVLFATIIGRRPERVLEIGTHKGGSAMIICAAMDQLKRGRLVCVDPRPVIAPEHWRQIEHRAILFSGPSPAILNRAVAAAGGPFDLALIDGDHEFHGAKADIDGVLPFLADEAYLLFHDAHFWQVAKAIDAALVEHPQLTDCGFQSAEEVREDQEQEGHPVIWGGLRVLRYLAQRTPARKSA